MRGNIGFHGVTNQIKSHVVWHFNADNFKSVFNYIAQLRIFAVSVKGADFMRHDDHLKRLDGTQFNKRL